MEITPFVLGMLTIVAVIILTVIVVGLVKINFLTRKIESLQQLCAAIENDLRQELENTNREVWKQFETAGRDVTIVERTIMNQIESIDREHLKHEEDLHREIDETKRYIDSRIDKVVSSGTIKEPKRQILKG
jgi:uncharacterized membrane-anchored protein YhcB (DUF1043 family)